MAWMEMTSTPKQLQCLLATRVLPDVEIGESRGSLVVPSVPLHGESAAALIAANTTAEICSDQRCQQMARR